MTGKVVDAWTSATMSGELEIVVIIQAAPTAWINPPMLETSVAAQSARNVVFLNGARGEVRCGT